LISTLLVDVRVKEQQTACHTHDSLVNTQPSLVVNLASAQGVKEHKCGICGREFTLLANMKRHVLIHTNIRAYQCHLCYKSFVQKQTLKAHMIVHSDVKPFKCKVGRRKDWEGVVCKSLTGKTLGNLLLDFFSSTTEAQRRPVAQSKSLHHSDPVSATRAHSGPSLVPLHMTVA
jgi:hypothetical protein